MTPSPSERLPARLCDDDGNRVDPSQAVASPRFFVAVHDVAPNEREALSMLLDELGARLGSCFALAVTPCYGGRSFGRADWAFLRDFLPERDRAPELLLHGLTHRRPPNAHPVSVVSRFSDEWTGLARIRLDTEIAEARTLIRQAFDRDPGGVVAPCWRWGAFDRTLMNKHRLGVAVGFRSAWFADPSRPLGRRDTPSAPSVVFHPVDVRRGLHQHGLRLIDQLIAVGARPARFDEGYA